MDVKRIYMLIREKKDKDPKQRIKEVFQNPVSNKKVDSKNRYRGRSVLG